MYVLLEFSWELATKHTDLRAVGPSRASAFFTMEVCIPSQHGKPKLPGIVQCCGAASLGAVHSAGAKEALTAILSKPSLQPPMQFIQGCCTQQDPASNN